MSQMGHSRPNWTVRAMSCLPPDSDRTADIVGGPVRASRVTSHRGKTESVFAGRSPQSGSQTAVSHDIGPAFQPARPA